MLYTNLISKKKINLKKTQSFAMGFIGRAGVNNFLHLINERTKFSAVFMEKLYSYARYKKFNNDLNLFFQSLSFFILHLYKFFFLNYFKNKNLNTFKFLFVDFFIVLMISLFFRF